MSGDIVRKISPKAIEHRRPSIIRASGHTFEYLGYGPGNYSTALPQLQIRTLTEKEEFLSQSQERGGGAVVYTGMNDKGDFYIGNQRKSALTGEEVTYDTPIPTVAGEDPARLSVVFDEVTVKDRLVVEGGDSKTTLSQFDGPVSFNGELKVRKPLRLKDKTESETVETGALIVSGGIGIGKNVTMGGNLALFSDKQIQLGDTDDGGDLQIYHDSSSDQSIIKSSKKISLMSEIGIEIEDETGKQLADFTKGGASRLFHDVEGDTTELKLATTATGVDVTGTLTCDGMTIDGALGVEGLTATGNVSLGNENTDTVTITGPVTMSCDTDSSSKTVGGTLTITGGAAIAKKLHVGDDIIAFATSDKRLKDNISPITKALSKVNSISGNTFNWNSASDYEGKGDTGVIAQEIEALDLPGVTTIRDDGTHAVNYEKLIPLLIEAIKELSNKVDALS